MPHKLALSWWSFCYKDWTKEDILDILNLAIPLNQLNLQSISKPPLKKRRGGVRQWQTSTA